MADSKISALPASTTPLTGTEVLPIVQSGATKQVSVANLTPGLNTITSDKGGTGLTSYSQGDLLYYNTGTTFTALSKNASATRYLSNTGTTNNPAWAQIDLSNGVTGVLAKANLPTGSILQVVSANITGSGGTPYFSTTSSSLSDTGLSATITPTSATSKILVLISANVWWVGNTPTTDQGGGWGLVRASTTIIATGFNSFYNGAVLGSTGTQSGITYLDSPATTSSTTYYVRAIRTSGSGTLALNHYGGGGVDDRTLYAASTITLMEIAA
jgi:hypothetical protein